MQTFLSDNINMDFVKRLDDLLIQKNLKRQALADYAGIVPATISTWKKRGTLPQADIAVKMAEFLGVSVEYLVNGKERNAREFTFIENEIIKYFPLLTDNDKENLLILAQGLSEKHKIDLSTKTVG